MHVVLSAYYSSDVPYDWNQKALANMPKGITPGDVYEVLTDNRLRRPVPGYFGALPVLTIWGRTGRGRAMIVALVPYSSRPRHWLIVGVDEMTEEEYAEFREWEETTRRRREEDAP